MLPSSGGRALSCCGRSTSLDRPTRYERTSELIKAFKHSCARVREEFHTLEMELPEFTAVLDELTKNTYVLIVVHDPTIGALSVPRVLLRILMAMISQRRRRCG